jgi:cell division protein FtsI (penicillin-binding protein 3)
MSLFAPAKFRRARCRVISEPRALAAPALAAIPAPGRARSGTRARRRIAMCALAFVAAYGALAARLATVSFAPPEDARAHRAIAAAHPDRRAGAPRADIVDRNGVILATELPMIALEIAGDEVWDPDETAARLAEAFPEIDRGALATKLAAGRYVAVRDDLTPAQRDAVFALGLPGVRFAERVRRFYPQGRLAAHVVGHVEPGKGGVMGLERVLDGRGGASPLAASIDVRAQQALEEVLAAALADHRAQAAWGAILDVNTGEVVALASLPDFDPNAPGAASDDWRRNRAVYDRYELGSAFKAFTAAAALDAGVAAETTAYDARGAFRVAGVPIRDYHGENRVLSFSEVIQHSSNIGMARMAGDLGRDRQRAALGALGLLARLPVELAENREPELPARWGPVETATIAYGHGVSVTPLHLVAAYAAVVNGGEYRPPTFLKADAPRPGARVFSERTSATMRRVLRRVVTDGTAAAAEAPGYYPIGKTATAEKPVAGGYDANARISSFVGAFPGHAPRYVALVSLDDPQSSAATHGYATAGWNAAPAFADLVLRTAPLLGVPAANEATALAGFYRGLKTADAGERREAGAR